MGQSLSQIYIHLTFGTFNRFPFLQPSEEESIHSYLAGALKNYECPVLAINSVSDHIHILFKLSKNHALARVVEEIKKQSSKWMKEFGKGYEKFSWQTGYGAFSVSASKLDITRKYILNQKEHHRIKSYQEEVYEFMKEYGISEYNPDYFWQ